jgi:predicted nucleic acid-binding protein
MAIRVFADANILIAGADSRTGASNAVLKMAEVGLYRLVVSHQVLDEAERNLRKKLPRALTNFATQMGQLILEIVPNPPKEESAKWEKIIEAKDAPILAAAVIAQVDCLVTLNTKDFTPYVAEQSGLLIQTPSEFVREIRSIVNAQFGRSS